MSTDHCKWFELDIVKVVLPKTVCGCFLFLMKEGKFINQSVTYSDMFTFALVLISRVTFIVSIYKVRNNRPGLQTKRLFLMGQPSIGNTTIYLYYI